MLLTIWHVRDVPAYFSLIKPTVDCRSNSVRIRYNESVRERRCDAAKLGGSERGDSDDAFIDF